MKNQSLAGGSLANGIALGSAAPAIVGVLIVAGILYAPSIWAQTSTDW